MATAQEAVRLYTTEQLSMEKVAARLGIDRTTVCRYLRLAGVKARPRSIANRKTQPNEIRHNSDGITTIILDYKGQPLECSIDTADFPLVSRHTWSPEKARKTFYAKYSYRQNGKPVVVRMHAVLLPTSLEVDHADRNGLNNRRLNLRPATRTQQGQNQKIAGRKFRGVSFESASQRWMSFIRINGKQTFLGRHDSPEAAARAYDAAAKEHHGEFAALNFPEEVLA